MVGHTTRAHQSLRSGLCWSPLFVGGVDGPVPSVLLEGLYLLVPADSSLDNVTQSGIAVRTPGQRACSAMHWTFQEPWAPTSTTSLSQTP